MSQTRATLIRLSERRRRSRGLRLTLRQQSSGPRCRRCGRPLTAPESVRRGVGVVCLVADYDDRGELRRARG